MYKKNVVIIYNYTKVCALLVDGVLGCVTLDDKVIREGRLLRFGDLERSSASESMYEWWRSKLLETSQLII